VVSLMQANDEEIDLMLAQKVDDGLNLASLDQVTAEFNAVTNHRSFELAI